MTKSKWKKSSPKLVERFYKVLEEFEEVEMRQMFGCSCSFYNGYMFTGLHEENWIVRLDADDIEDARQTFHLKNFDPMKGRPMREYLVFPPSLTKELSTIQHWVQRSLNYVSSLPPKPKKALKKRKN